MTGDVKLGLLVGVGVVIAAALVYYRPEGVQAGGEPAAMKAPVSNGNRSVQLSPAQLSTPPN